MSSSSSKLGQRSLRVLNLRFVQQLKSWKILPYLKFNSVSSALPYLLTSDLVHCSSSHIDYSATDPGAVLILEHVVLNFSL